MSFQIKELREKQVKLAHDLPRFVADAKAKNNGVMDALAVETFKRMEGDFNDLRSQIETAEIEERTSQLAVAQPEVKPEVRYSNPRRTSDGNDRAIYSWLCSHVKDAEMRAEAVNAGKNLWADYGVAPFETHGYKGVNIRLQPKAPKHVNEIRGTSSQGAGDSTLGAEFVPTTLSNEIERARLAFGNIRAVAKVIRTPGAGSFKVPKTSDTSNKSTLITEHTGDTVVDIATSSVTLTGYEITTGLVKFSMEWQRDSQYNVLDFVASILAERDARGSNYLLTLGSGSSTVQGYVTGAGTAVTLAHYSAAPTYDEIRQAYFSIDPSYRNVPTFAWAMSDNFLSNLWAIQDDIGRPLMFAAFASLATTGALSLFGAPIYVNNHMASMGTGAKVATLGDWDKFLIREVGDPIFAVSTERYFEYRETACVLLSCLDAKVLTNSALKNVVCGSTG